MYVGRILLTIERNPEVTIHEMSDGRFCSVDKFNQPIECARSAWDLYAPRVEEMIAVAAVVRDGLSKQRPGRAVGGIFLKL